MDSKQQQQMEAINHNAFLSSQGKMNTVYRKQKQALNEVTALVALLYINYAVSGLIKLNKGQKLREIRKIEDKLKIMYKDLGSYEVSKLTDLLKNTYQEVYDDLYSYLAEDKAKKQRLTDEEIMLAVNMPIAGELYVDRIWKNKDKTVNLLRKASNNILKGDMTIDEAKKQIEKVFNVQAYDTQRLSDSELTRVIAQGSTDVSTDLGYKKHMWSATFEHTCKECKALHGKIFVIGDKSAPTIPLHANCQCIWINLESSSIINLPDTIIGRSIGAKAKNYDIKLPNGEYVNLVEGTKITNSTVIAGKGKNRQIDELDGLVADYGGNPDEWQKAKGFGYVNVDGEELKAELHWYQEPSIGKVKMKIKPQRDGEIFIYED